MNYWANKLQNNTNVPPPAVKSSIINMPNMAGPVITPPLNANPFQTQPNIYPNQSGGYQSNEQSGMLQQPAFQQMGAMVNTAYENFRKSVVDSKEDGDDMILTVKIPTNVLKMDPNFSFLFQK